MVTKHGELQIAPFPSKKNTFWMSTTARSGLHQLLVLPPRWFPLGDVKFIRSIWEVSSLQGVNGKYLGSVHEVYSYMYIYSIYLSISSIYLSVCLSVSLSLYLFLSIYFSLSLYLSLSTSFFIYLSISLYLSIYLSIYLSTYLSIYLSIYRDMFVVYGRTLQWVANGYVMKGICIPCFFLGGP